MIIYKASNKINGKIYIGQTCKSLDERFSNHLTNKKSLIGKALNKYGIESFEISVIDSALTREELYEKEKFWIKELNSLTPNGYNLTKGGDGVIGYIFSEEVKKKISVRTKEVMSKFSEEKRNLLRMRKGIPSWNKGLEDCFSQEALIRMSESHKGQTSGNKGKKYPYKKRGHRPDMMGENNIAKRPEVRQKIKDNNPMKRPEVVEKLIMSKTGMKYKKETKHRKKRPPVSETTRKLLSISATNQWRKYREELNKNVL